ncbi:phospholipase D-like domain-containing protein [Alteromonas gracilis]
MDAWTWPELLAPAFVALDLLIKVVAVGVVPENRHPSSSTAWLLLILLIPVVGLPLFLILGSPRVRGRRHRIQAQANDLIAETLADRPDVPPDAAVPADLLGVIRLNRRLTSLPAVTGTNLGVCSDYVESIRRMAADVDRATDFVHAEFYCLALDETTEVFVAALTAAADRGITVRVLYDHLGSRGYDRHRELLRRLADHGVAVHAMLPLRPWRGQWRRPDLRNHRKLLVVDSRVAHMGSQNMIDATYGRGPSRGQVRRYRDVTVRLDGQIVSALDSVFAVDWFKETGERVEVAEPGPPAPQVGGAVSVFQLVPSGPGFDTEPNLRMFTSLIHRAQHSISLVSPYFVPDESLLSALTTAAYRGVAVELVVSEASDGFMVERAQRSYYRALLESGVRIQRFRAPAILHSKFMTVDDEVAVMGSSNMDMRSFGLNYEIMLLATGGDVDDELRELVAAYRSGSVELTAEEWARRPWWERYLENLMRLTSALQ